MSSLFCCSDTKPYRAQSISQEQKFKKFLEWARGPNAETSIQDSDTVTARLNESDSQTFVIQLVRQIDFGAVESKRYFMGPLGGSDDFCELAEGLVADKKFQKLNAYKNFKCAPHKKFFELNIYEENPANKQKGRANVARPAGDIDL